MNPNNNPNPNPNSNPNPNPTPNTRNTKSIQAIVTANIPAPSCCNNATTPLAASNSSVPCSNVVTIPVPIVHNDENYTYVAVKGSLHDFTTTIFGLNDAETKALTKRFERLEQTVKPVVNGIIVSVPLMELINTLAELHYKVVCMSGETEICWTMEREV